MSKIICLLTVMFIVIFISSCTKKTEEKETSGSVEETMELDHAYSEGENIESSEIKEVNFAGSENIKSTVSQETQESASVKSESQGGELLQGDVSTVVNTSVSVLQEDKKPTINEIQQALKNVGLYKGKIDGEAGPKTKEAIKVFQEQNNLVVDGKVGPKTWQKLYLYLNKTQESSVQRR